MKSPAGFDTPTLVKNPGSKSQSNGIAEPPGDSFALDQQIYETQHDVNSGLGPVFNGRACAECHQNPVTGGPSQITEVRVGHKDANGNFANPTILINDGASTISGRSLVNDRATCPQAQEHVPDSENIRARRARIFSVTGMCSCASGRTARSLMIERPEMRAAPWSMSTVGFTKLPLASRCPTRSSVNWLAPPVTGF